MNQQQFIEACKTGDIKTIEEGLLSDDMDINQAEDDGWTPLHEACSKGHKAVVMLLLQNGATAVINQADKYGYTTFHMACYTGHEAVVRLLLQQGADINQANDNGYTPLHIACSQDYEAVVALLLQQDGIRINLRSNFGRTPFFTAIKSARGRKAATLLLEVLYQTRKGYSQIKAVMKKDGLEADKIAFVKSHVKNLNQVKAAKQLAFAATNQGQFIQACAKGQLRQVKKLFTTPGVDINAPCAYHETALFKACAEGRTNVVKFLLRQKGIHSHQADNAGQTPLHIACADGHTKVVKLLLTHDYIDVNLRDNDGDTPLKIARQGGHSVIIKLLLGRADIIIDAASFDYLEQHQQEYGQYIDWYTQNDLAQLQKAIETFHQHHPNEVFDFPRDDAGNPDAEPSLKGYYILRYLIRCSQANSLSELANHLDILENINRLLTIPSIKTLVITNAIGCHMPDNYRDRGQPRYRFASQTNELLRLAQSVGHEGIVMRLLDIPAIREATENNHYYQGEAADDLREVAQNRESSMRALTPQEQASVAQIEAAYKETIKNQGGASKVMTALKQILKKRYLADKESRTVILGNASYLLPFEWDKLQLLLEEHKVTPEQRQTILAVYYKNNNHTAYRYFSKPNRWMSDNAYYVNGDRNGCWSTFEEYQTLMAYLWVAANDDSQPPREANITVADRVDLFIRQIALLNRAHNWDKHRRVMDALGNLVVEEYDDVEGDKPSCYSGVKSRLFQALLYHPIYEILDKSVTQQFIKDAIHQHYTKILNDNTVEELQILQTAVGNYFIEFKTTLELETLAFTDMQRSTIKATFINHYGEKRAAPFLPIVDELLKKDGLISNDFLRFYQSAHLDKLFETMQNTYLARKIINEVVLTHVRKLAQPQTENEFEAVNQLLFAIKNQGIGCIWDEIKNVVKDQYSQVAQENVNDPAWETIKDSVDTVFLTSTTQRLIQVEIKTTIKQSDGYQAHRNNHPELDKQSLFWVTPESSQWTLMGCVKAAVTEYQEKSQFSPK